MFLHSLLLSYGLGAVAGLLLGLLALKLFGARWQAQIEKQQARKAARLAASDK